MATKKKTYALNRGCRLNLTTGETLAKRGATVELTLKEAEANGFAENGQGYLIEYVPPPKKEADDAAVSGDGSEAGGK
jgi:hypothetical protein